jgi:hypothetical protein
MVRLPPDRPAATLLAMAADLAVTFARLRALPLRG